MAPKAKAAASATTTVRKNTKSASAPKKAGPKRPMSAFFQYLQERRPKLCEEKPELKSKAKEVGKIIGDEWRSMSESQKAPYKAKAEEDKKRYEAQKAVTAE